MQSFKGDSQHKKCYHPISVIIQLISFRVDSGSVDLETPLELSPKSPLEALDDALNAVMPNLGTLNNVNQPTPTPPPRNKQNAKGEQNTLNTQPMSLAQSLICLYFRCDPKQCLC